MKPPIGKRPPCPGCQQFYQAKQHCQSPTCTWLSCKCGTTYSRIHPANHYSNDA